MAAKIAIKWVVPRFSQRSKKVRIQGREYDPPHLAYLMAVKGVGNFALLVVVDYACYNELANDLIL